MQSLGSYQSGLAADEKLKSEEIFGMMSTYLSRGLGKEVIPKVQAVFSFEITRVKGGKVEVIYEIDLKNG